MSWIIKDHYQDEDGFEADKMALESMDITAFSCSKLLIIEVPINEKDLDKMSQVYEVLFPGLFEDMLKMMNSVDKDPYKVRFFYKNRNSDSKKLE
jgi:hypothetical protein